MKLSTNPSRFTFHASRSRRHETGSAVIIVLALLTILLIYVAGNIRTLNSLGRELRLLERQQTIRLEHTATATNAPAHHSNTPSLR